MGQYECCKWCSAIAGRYEYSEAPEDIYRRHDNCGCTVTYENGRTRQDVWSKKTWEVPEVKQKNSTPKKLSYEQGKAIEKRNMPHVGVDKSGGSGIIKLDMQFFGKKSEEFATIILPRQEYAHVMSEIATNISEGQKNKKVFKKPIGDYIYTVENNGFGNYRIIGKAKIEDED